MKYHFELALLPDGWANQIELEFDIRTGLISRIERNSNAKDSLATIVPGAAVPGFINAHSHAFQRAFTGLSEYRTQEGDSFWTWRKLMYEFVATLTPDKVYEIALTLYRDMLDNGYTSVCEFHYIHNSQNGQPYSDISEMSNAVIRAANDAGIAICILPVLYQRGGFDDRDIEGGQKRFQLTDDQFFELLSSLKRQWKSHSHVSIGMAFHSLRAVSIETMKRVEHQFRSMFPRGPIHIHIAEQTQEVEECLVHHSQRPVELLFDNFDVDDHWCLIHATHLTDDECAAIASSQATVCVCPTTEANLGDGIFQAEEYLLEHSGNIAIGSDSNIALNPFSELRLLEYGQRLSKRRRAILCTEDLSTGRFLCEKSWLGGSRISDKQSGGLAVGARADVVMLEIDNADHDHFLKSPDRLLDYCMFNENRPVVQRTICGGRILNSTQS